MKKKLVVLLAACLAAICFANAQDMDIQGTWKLVSRNGKPLPEHFTQIKMITASHYIWTLTDNQGNIIDGAGGTYELEGNKFTGLIDKVLPHMKTFYNYKPTFYITIDGNKMIQKGNMRASKVFEVWERIDEQPASRKVVVESGLELWD